MSTRGRPRRHEAVVEFHLHLWLVYGEDDDLISALEGVPARQRSAWIKRMLRQGGLQADAVAEDLNQTELDALHSALDALLM